MKSTLLDTQSIQDILAGRKIMMRRTDNRIPAEAQRVEMQRGHRAAFYWEHQWSGCAWVYLKPRHLPGDVIYVKEPYRGPGIYKADDPSGKWCNPMTMAPSMARLFLFIKEVRIERLQQISEADMRAEGGDFVKRWDALHKETPWHSNPWVWVYTFERLE